MSCLGVQIGSSCARRRASVPGRTLERVYFERRRLRCRSPGVCSAKLVAENTLRFAVPEAKSSARAKKKPAITPQLDLIMKHSVAEIVKNISEAPFLVHVYSEAEDADEEDEHSPNCALRMEIERATSDRWPFIRQRWEGGNFAAPYGVILVEELCSEEEEDITPPSSTAAYCTSNQRLLTPSSPPTKVWGLVVQGRGATFPVCYILKTCQVQCCSGYATHFCLAKVDCFGKGLEFHLKRMWLQR